MTAPVAKRPPLPPPAPLKIVVNVPTMRVACRVCRNSSQTVTGPGRVEVVIACRCVEPDFVIVASFPGKDVNIPIEKVNP